MRSDVTGQIVIAQNLVINPVAAAGIEAGDVTFRSSQRVVFGDEGSMIRQTAADRVCIVSDVVIKAAFAVGGSVVMALIVRRDAVVVAGPDVPVQRVVTVADRDRHATGVVSGFGLGSQVAIRIVNIFQ